jgi:hypothetical protein
VDFDDKVINATVRGLGGWDALCVRFSEGVEKETWIRKDFTRIYAVMAKRPLSEEQLSPLGRTPVRIGSRQAPERLRIAARKEKDELRARDKAIREQRRKAREEI